MDIQIKQKEISVMIYTADAVILSPEWSSVSESECPHKFVDWPDDEMII